ncbi:Thyroid adenoma-associated protein-like [Papilio machaon]|uniref:tRNA (32-2'-O)-methyltransferase regulator THADA n=1 Tax=Papilio machaon TaxID=76193 RepID=A0A194RHI9_PAPMA|nr:Thyroid adenoma-associated protein-like [Papilio machaon]
MSECARCTRWRARCAPQDTPTCTARCTACCTYCSMSTQGERCRSALAARAGGRGARRKTRPHVRRAALHAAHTAACRHKVRDVGVRSLHALAGEVRACERSVVRAARHAHMYGALHCMLHILQHVDTRAISESQQWSMLIAEIVQTCFEVNAAVACVVNNSSPEGHLPMDMSGPVLGDTDNSQNLELDDGRPVTAQMVLLCAWRSVKEVSLVLGCIASRLSIAGEEQEHGTLTQRQVVAMGEHFTKLLAETKHRGAFEQAYVGFTHLLARLWRCRGGMLHALPGGWLRDLMTTLASEAGGGSLCATRRSAGLPFMIQALVTTELQVSDKPKCFHECVMTLMQLCGGGGGGAVLRAHCCNVLRALVRCSALQQAVAPYVGDALLLALKGFDGPTWEERNSSTLLLSALVVRVFGVARGADAGGAGGGGGGAGGGVGFNSGRSCNNSLSRFMSVVCECGRSAVLKTRQLAAQALLPLVSPAMYIPHIEEMLALLSNQNIKRNFCHGILLQVTKLLNNRPDNLSVDDMATARLQDKIQQSCWILQQGAGPQPCYLIAEEYNNMINLIVWKFPSLIHTTMITKITYYLDIMLSKSKDLTAALSGRDLCLASAANLSYVLVNKYGQTDELKKLIYKFLLHDSYEVTLTALNYLLILNKDFEIENSFQEHLNILTKDKNLLIELRKDDNYSKTLYKVFITTKYLECKQKCLKLLSLEENTYKYMIQGDVREIGDDVSELDDDVIVRELTRLVDTQHENMTHIYLYSLTTFLTDKINEPQVNGNLILNCVRTIFDCSSSRNSFSTRSVVANFLENNFKSLIDLELMDLSEEDKFEVEASLWASLVLILEDDEEAVRLAGARTVGGVAAALGAWPAARGAWPAARGRGLRHWGCGGVRTRRRGAARAGVAAAKQMCVRLQRVSHSIHTTQGHSVSSAVHISMSSYV